MNNNNNNIRGYIEGYYGKLLNWEDRKSIIISLNKNDMNTFFYAPKEDQKHRFNWKENYSINWRKSFRDFAYFSKKNNINIIAGIAPGLDFNFKDFNDYKKKNHSHDFNLLYNKAKQLLDDGATSIALLLDDIPENYKNKFGNKISEGTSHGLLANKLSEKLDQDIFFVPRIYADELIKDEPFYLKDLSKILNHKTMVFYCGKNVVSKKLTNISGINKMLCNEIIFWDNFYSNDYCPRRFFIGPYLGRKNINNIMINPTGLINTDLLILDIVASSLTQKFSIKQWSKILNDHGVPLIFSKIKHFFLKPDFGFNPLPNSFDINDEHFDALDYLLWRWKGALSREWYPYLFGLKHDLQLKKNILPSERLVKTQTAPLSKYLNKNLIKGELK